MKYTPDILAAHGDAGKLEELYQAARRQNAVAEFTVDLLACHAQAPGNLLYAAWYYRLRPAPPERAAGRDLKWPLAIPLGLVTGLAFWALSRNPLLHPPDGRLPYLGFLWAPIAAWAIIALLTATGSRHPRRVLAVGLGLAVATAYAIVLADPRAREQYATLMLLHVPALAWIGVGLAVLGRRPDRDNLFAFLLKSIEVVIAGGVFGLAGGLFATITSGLFAALQVQIPRDVAEFLAIVGAGAVPVLAVASVYDPRLAPLEQRFEHGLGRLLPTLTRVLLPLAIVVLLVYLFVIPFNFTAPFRDRQLLIIYNVLLFAVMALLIGATPLQADDLPGKQQSLLRLGIIVLAGLTALVSLYALAAVTYRTALGGFTLNRLTVIGWNSINIAILSILGWRQIRGRREDWLGSLHSTFASAAAPYVAWTLFLIFVAPWLLR